MRWNWQENNYGPGGPHAVLIRFIASFHHSLPVSLLCHLIIWRKIERNKISSKLVGTPRCPHPEFPSPSTWNSFVLFPSLHTSHQSQPSRSELYSFNKRLFYWPLVVSQAACELQGIQYWARPVWRLPSWNLYSSVGSQLGKTFPHIGHSDVNGGTFGCQITETTYWHLASNIWDNLTQRRTLLSKMPKALDWEINNCNRRH